MFGADSEPAGEPVQALRLAWPCNPMRTLILADANALACTLADGLDLD